MSIKIDLIKMIKAREQLTNCALGAGDAVRVLFTRSDTGELFQFCFSGDSTLPRASPSCWLEHWAKSLLQTHRAKLSSQLAGCSCYEQVLSSA